jgi:hypothetical protein
MSKSKVLLSNFSVLLAFFWLGLVFPVGNQLIRTIVTLIVAVTLLGIVIAQCSYKVKEHKKVWHSIIVIILLIFSIIVKVIQLVGYSLGYSTF